MSTSRKRIDLQEYIRLPLRVLTVADRALPDIVIKTPHKGDVQVTLKEEHYPFLFGSVTQTDKHAIQILKELEKIEDDAIDYLLKQWKVSHDL